MNFCCHEIWRGGRIPTMNIGMRNFRIGVVLVLVSNTLLVPQPLRQGSRQSFFSTRELAAKVSKSLVLVVTEDHEHNTIAQGSGFFLEPGLVATNLHVLKYASKAHIKSLSDGLAYKIASIAGFDLKHDLCILRILGANGTPLKLSTQPVVVGDEIVVGGNPEGLEASFSKGIVSGIRSRSGLIQMDAAISPGSSGGPVVNQDGDVIGVTVSSLIEGQNLNFAIPVRYLREQRLDWNLPIESVGGLSIPDLERDGFRGRVKAFTETHAQDVFNEAANNYVEGPTLIYTAVKYSSEGRVQEITFFKNGLENGKQLWKYSDDGLIEEDIDIDSQGHRQSHEYSIEEAVATQSLRANFDGIVGFGVKGDPEYQQYKYDNAGHLVERTFPQQGLQSLMKYDSRGREIESLEYSRGTLQSVTRSTYEDNEHGDWIKCHQTVWLAKYPNLGFTPWMEQYRQITYYDEN